MFRKLLSSGITFIMLLTSLAVLICLHIAGAFYPPIISYLSSLHIYELAILIVLIELLYLSIHRPPPAGPYHICAMERDYYPKLMENVSKRHPESIEMVSAGLSSRYQLITDLLDFQIPTRVLVQTEDIAVDKSDARRLHTMIDSICRSTSEKCLTYLEIRAMSSIASVRSIVVNRKTAEDTLCLISWYTYGASKKIMGQKSPCIAVDGKSIEGRFLIDFARRSFADNWEASMDRIVFPKKNNNV